MQVQDNPRWLGQQAEIIQDMDSDATPDYLTGQGQFFINFITDWCDTAEEAMHYLGSVLTPVEALRAALEPIELRRGTLSGNWMAQMLLVIVAHWEHGPQVYADMTPFERRFVDNMAALITVKNQEAAQEVPHAPTTAASSM
jgi:hypothetical protein